MKKSRFSEEKIISILREADADVKARTARPAPAFDQSSFAVRTP